MLNVLIISEDINYCKSFLNLTSEYCTELRISAIATNLSEGIEILNSGLIDITVINSDCGVDAIVRSFNALEEAYYEDFNNSMIVITKPGTKSYINHPFIYDYVFSKPNNMDTILIRLREIAKNKIVKKRNSDLTNKINKELAYIGYNLSYTGTQYLSESIAFMYNNSTNENNLLRNVYPAIAKKHNKSIDNIKCNISKATTIMFYECEESRLKDYFNFCTTAQPKPKLVMYTILNKLNDSKNSKDSKDKE